MQRVVVTGMGIVSPLGLGVSHVWLRLINGESGIASIRAFDTQDHLCKIAGEVPHGPKAQHSFDLSEWFSEKEQQRIGRYAQLALVAAAEAVTDSGWYPESEADRCMTGVMIGSGFGGIATVHDVAIGMQKDATYRPPQNFLSLTLINMAAAEIGARFGAHGPIRAVMTACASGVHALGDAARMIQMGDAEVMIAGATEAAICPLVSAGFSAARALSSNFNDTPDKASRPWDQDRDGFVMGEGAAVLILESYEHARKRGAQIYVEIAGYGISGDASHITAPADGHEGAFRAMVAALRNGKIAVKDVQYINAHGTSTPLGDDLELEAVGRVFDGAARNLAMSSTKSAVGHLLGAAGAVESLFSIMAVRTGVVPPTLNLHRPSRQSEIDRVANVAQERTIKHALCNSFGFGGTNAVIAFRSV